MNLATRINADLDKPFNASSPYSILDLIEDTLALDLNVYVVGGATRDWLQGQSVSDIDLVIDGEMGPLYEFCKTLFTEDSLTYFDNLGLLKIKGELADVDINIMRDETQTKPIWDQSNYSVINDIDKDYLNRDFSINCFYYNCRTKEFQNPVAGADVDLKNKELKLITGPTKMKYDQRICLRILKFIAQGYVSNKETDKVLDNRFEQAVLSFSDFEKWLNFTTHKQCPHHESFKEVALAQNISADAKSRLSAMFDRMA